MPTSHWPLAVHSLCARARDASGRPQLELSTRYYYEDRIGGTADYIKKYSDALRGSDLIYGESISTHRIEMIGMLNLKPETGARLDASLNFHDQDSFYGADSYSARQSTVFMQLLWPMRLSGRQTLLLGSALRGQRYDDNTSATGLKSEAGTTLKNLPDNRWIPSLFAQLEWLTSESA